MTPVSCCGFECGVFLSGVGPHWFPTGAPVAVTSPVRNGARALRCNAAGSIVSVTSALTIGLTRVTRFYIYFQTSLPNVDTTLARPANADTGLFFQASDAKLYAKVGASKSATGVSVTTGVWYRIDLRIEDNGSNLLVDLQVDGTAVAQVSGAAVGSDVFALGVVTTGVTADVLFDDFVASATSGDYPIGPGKVEHFVPTADGTHNVASTNDFERSDTGTDIDNTTTDAYLLVDDVPLTTGTPAEFINLILPPSATDYVEVVYGPAPGISAPTTAPRAVEVITVSAAKAVQANNLRLALNDNGTLDDVRNATVGSTTCIYDRKQYPLAPTGGAWTISAGNGNFNNLRMRCFSDDANPDPYFVGTMIEAEFAEAEGDVTVTPPALATASNSFAPKLNFTQIVPTKATSIATFVPSISLGTIITPSVAIETTTQFSPQLQLAVITQLNAAATTSLIPVLQTEVTPNLASSSTATFEPQLMFGVTFTPPIAALITGAFAPQMLLTLVVQSATVSVMGFEPQLQELVSIDAIALSATLNNAVVDHGVVPTSIVVTTTPSEPKLSSTLSVPATALLVNTFALQLQTTIVLNNTNLASNAFSPQLVVTISIGLSIINTTELIPVLDTALVPTSESFAINEFIPSLQFGVNITIPALVLSAGNFAPVLQHSVIVFTDAKFINTFSPSLGNDVTATPSAISLTINTFSSQLQSNIPIALVVLAIEEFVPELTISVQIATATLTTNQFAPSLTHTIISALQSLNTDGFVPQLDNVANVGLSVQTINTFAPSLAGILTLTPETVNALLVQFAPQLQETIAVPSQTLNSSMLVPTINVGTTIVAVTSGLLQTLFVPILKHSIPIQTSANVIGSFAPTVDVPTFVIPFAATINTDEFAPTTDHSVIVSSLALVGDYFSPTLQQSLIVVTHELNSSFFAPTIGHPFTPVNALLSFNNFAPTITLGETTPLLQLPRIKASAYAQVVFSGGGGGVVHRPVIGEIKRLPSV